MSLQRKIKSLVEKWAAINSSAELVQIDNDGTRNHLDDCQLANILMFTQF